MVVQQLQEERLTADIEPWYHRIGEMSRVSRNGHEFHYVKPALQALTFQRNEDVELGGYKSHHVGDLWVWIDPVKK